MESTLPSLASTLFIVLCAFEAKILGLQVLEKFIFYMCCLNTSGREVGLFSLQTYFFIDFSITQHNVLKQHGTHLSAQCFSNGWVHCPTITFQEQQLLNCGKRETHFQALKSRLVT
jgi:hypothetical protein